MAFKSVIFFGAQVLLFQSAFSQYLRPITAGRTGSFGLTGPALGSAAYACGAGTASSGGSFAVTSTSPIAPTGVSVVSENTIEGALSADGYLPLLGTVVLEGSFPSIGAGAVPYGCGSSSIGIANEGPITTGILGRSAGTTLSLAACPRGASGGYGPSFGLNGLGLGLDAPCSALY